MKKIIPLKSSKRTASVIDEQLPPKIEFPCADYPLKVIGHNTDDLKEFVIELLFKYDEHIDMSKVTHQDSKNAKFRSIRLFITAQSEAQLITLNDELKASGRVITVL
ncbi:MAG: putative lipoic acid-binding regulatory protein [Oceanospirillaceae bacterium]|jgi:putative lipoic acid-binding regulatory protein